MKLVSIIMTCFNGEKYLQESISSILSQYYQDWELIFVDNNSTDKSKEIISNFKDKRIRYFKLNSTVNLGKIRKFAFLKCRGELISFLDVDDYWDKSKLTEQVEIFETNKNADIVYSNYYQLNSGELKKNIKKLYSGFCYKSIIKGYIEGKPLTAWLTLMIKKDIIDKLEYSFDENLHISSDFDLIIRLGKDSYFDYSEKYLAYYRIHSSNLSKDNSQEIDELSYIISKYKTNLEISKLLDLKSFADKILLRNYINKKISNINNSNSITLKNNFIKILFLIIKITPIKVLKFFK